MSHTNLSLEPSLFTLSVAPAKVIRGFGALTQVAGMVSALGKRPCVISGDRSLKTAAPFLEAALADTSPQMASYGADCSEDSLTNLRQVVQTHRADLIVGVGGGKALDAAKLVADQCQMPIVTIPTSAATCAAWTALSNVYSPQGAFLYDVPLTRCPDLLVLDYSLVLTADRRTLVAGIGDGLAKWYEASVSSGQSERTLTIAAVQQARVLRDILLQKGQLALQEPGSPTWCDVVDASVLLAGAIGGLGGAQCRTVAAHAVHNGLTHLLACHDILHGEKVAYGVLVQLRLEEMLQGNQLAATARHQLLRFYEQLGLPRTLADLGLATASLTDLLRAAEITCQPQSDIHRLPFRVVPEQLMAAMVSTLAPIVPEPASLMNGAGYP